MSFFYPRLEAKKKNKYFKIIPILSRQTVYKTNYLRLIKYRAMALLQLKKKPSDFRWSNSWRSQTSKSKVAYKIQFLGLRQSWQLSSHLRGSCP